MPCEDESADCKNAREDYNRAASDRSQAESDIHDCFDHRFVSAGVAGVATGVAVAAALATNPVGWLILAGAAVAALGAGAAARSHLELAKARARCKDALDRMNDAFNRADRSCKSKDCVPPRPTPCP